MPTIMPSATAFTFLEQNLPVVDDEMNLTGILSETDVVGLIYDRGSMETKEVRHFMKGPRASRTEQEAATP